MCAEAIAEKPMGFGNCLDTVQDPGNVRRSSTLLAILIGLCPKPS